MKTNDEIDEMIKDYIASDDLIEPDDSNEIIIDTPPKIAFNPSDYSDLLDDTLDTIDISNLGNLTFNTPTQSDITICVDGKDRSVSELFNAIDTIEKRLGILHPDPKLLDKYELLQSLYGQYKAAEAMLYEDNNEEGDLPF